MNVQANPPCLPNGLRFHGPGKQFQSNWIKANTDQHKRWLLECIVSFGFAAMTMKRGPRATWKDVHIVGKAVIVDDALEGDALVDALEWARDRTATLQAQAECKRLGIREIVPGDLKNQRERELVEWLVEAGADVLIALGERNVVVTGTEKPFVMLFGDAGSDRTAQLEWVCREVARRWPSEESRPVTPVAAAHR